MPIGELSKEENSVMENMAGLFLPEFICSNVAFYVDTIHVDLYFLGSDTSAYRVDIDVQNNWITFVCEDSYERGINRDPETETIFEIGYNLCDDNTVMEARKQLIEVIKKQAKKDLERHENCVLDLTANLAMCEET